MFVLGISIMAETICCYVCEKPNSKRCTRCIQIAYCGSQCQRQDWKYHKRTCSQNPNNVVDMLIKLGEYNIFQKIFRSLSGLEIHNFRGVNRSWRDMVLNLGKLKSVRSDWEKKLVQQWTAENHMIITVAKDKPGASHIAVCGEDLFVDILGRPVIKVYDITTFKYKYSIRAANDQSSCWDVHKDFLLIFDGVKFSIWDRHARKEVRVPDTCAMQAGKHCKVEGHDDSEDDDARIIFPSKIMKVGDDIPVLIKIFSCRGVKEDAILVVYSSGIISRWSYRTPYQNSNADAAENFGGKEFVFSHVKSSNVLSGIYNHCCLIQSFDQVLLQQPCHDIENNLVKHSKLFYCDGESMVGIDMENDSKSAVLFSMRGVDRIHYFYESDKLPTGVTGDVHQEYILLTRSMAHVQQEFKQRAKVVERLYEQGKQEGSYEDWLKSQVVQTSDEQSKGMEYLEIHATVNGKFRLLRRLKFRCLSFKGVCLNNEHLIVSSLIYIAIFNAKEIIANKDYCVRNGVKYVDAPEPVAVFEFDLGFWRRYLYLAEPNRLLWMEDVARSSKDQGNGAQNDKEGEEEGNVKCVNFWMV